MQCPDCYLRNKLRNRLATRADSLPIVRARLDCNVGYTPIMIISVYLERKYKYLILVKFRVSDFASRKRPLYTEVCALPLLPPAPVRPHRAKLNTMPQLIHRHLRLDLLHSLNSFPTFDCLHSHLPSLRRTPSTLSSRSYLGRSCI
jgi:hypothetical protein